MQNKPAKRDRDYLGLEKRSNSNLKKKIQATGRECRRYLRTTQIITSLPVLSTPCRYSIMRNPLEQNPHESSINRTLNTVKSLIRKQLLKTCTS